MQKFFPADKIVITGNPVRKSITNISVSKAEALKFFGLDAERKTILVVGGSLGAKSINEAIEKGIKELLDNNLQLIWQTGKLYSAKATEMVAGKKHIWVGDFISQMENAYSAADIVISRAGAMAIAELCLVEKPVLFVPYPFAAEDHQTENAQNLVNKNAALMVKDNEAIDKVVPMIIDLSKNEQKQKELKENIKKLAIKNADEVIAAEIIKALN
jgi:UDP-N-acetylglucosamine--N-acetylmuramyl-(pentapeptide) pyrophosphoryl-undecaprenol N-acetylglucosamine transferase